MEAQVYLAGISGPQVQAEAQVYPPSKLWPWRLKFNEEPRSSHMVDLGTGIKIVLIPSTPSTNLESVLCESGISSTFHILKDAKNSPTT